RRRSVTDDAIRARRLERLLGARQILGELLAPEPRQAARPIPAARDLVSAANDLLHDLRLSVGDATEDEERGVRVVLGEKIEHRVEARLEARLEAIPVFAEDGVGTS